MDNGLPSSNVLEDQDSPCLRPSLCVEHVFEQIALPPLEHLIQHQGLVGLGLDVAEPGRMQRLRSRPKALLQQVLTEREQMLVEHSSEPLVQLAAAFATKEAVFKALGTSWLESAVTWSEVELLSSFEPQSRQVWEGPPDDEGPPGSESALAADSVGRRASRLQSLQSRPAQVEVSGACKVRQCALKGTVWQVRLTFQNGQVIALALLLGARYSTVSVPGEPDSGGPGGLSG